jgi:hypothetical protein
MWLWEYGAAPVFVFEIAMTKEILTTGARGGADGSCTAASRKVAGLIPDWVT